MTPMAVPVAQSAVPSYVAKATTAVASQPTDKSIPLQTCSKTENAADEVSNLRAALVSESTPLAVRFRALFSLKHHAAQHPPTLQTLPAIHAIAAALDSPSALLKHELAYCLGQSSNNAAVPFLQDLVKNREEDAMCRHEAAEALGALGSKESLDMLTERWQDDTEAEVVRETCEIAVGRIKWVHSDLTKMENIRQSDFSSIDPAPPEAVAQDQGISRKDPSVVDLRGRLLDTNLGLFERYRAMFALRDLASPPDLPTAADAVNALADGLGDKSALFRHEVAFVFGQLSHPASIPALKTTLAKADEQSMVRHEAAEALGSLGDEPGVEDFLKHFIDDPEQVVRESVVVALDMADFERKGDLEYAVIPSEAKNAFSPLVQPGVV